MISNQLMADKQVPDDLRKGVMTTSVRRLDRRIDHDSKGVVAIDYRVNN